MSTTVRDNPAQSRYEIHDGDTLAGFADYKLQPGQIAFTHTETEPGFAGRGLAKRLVAEALDDTRRRGLAVLPFCPYVRGFIAGNADGYLDLVREEDRTRFELPPSAS
jgi:uncharacterized protein